MNKQKIFQFLNRLRDNKLFVPAVGFITLAVLLFVFKSAFIAALVNGQVISRVNLTQELEKRSGKEVLENLVEKALISQEAKKLGVKVSKDDIDKEIGSIEETLKGQKTNLKDALSLRGLTMADLVEQIKLQKTVEAILSQKISISEEEIKDYFTQNKDVFGKGAKLDEVKERIREQLRQQKLGTEYQKWLNELKTKAKINYFVHP